MGTKVAIENYLPGHYSMGDLSLESNGASWPSHYSDVNLPNGKLYHGFLPKTIADSYTGYDKDIVRQTMLKHEAIFKDQVYELHRLYRVQRDLMDELRKKEQLRRRIPNETSSSSNPLPSQMQSEDAQRCNGSSFPFANPNFGRPLIPVPNNVQSLLISAKGKSIQAGSSPKCSEILESRPTKLRRRILDLELPADDYIDIDEVEQFGQEKEFVDLSVSPDEDRKPTFLNGRMFSSYPGKECQGDAPRSGLQIGKSTALADLNQTFHAEQLTTLSSVDFIGHNGSHNNVPYWDLPARLLISSKDIPQYSKNGGLNGTLNNLQDIRGNGRDWFSNAFESEQYEASVNPIRQGILPEKAHVPSQLVHVLLNQAYQPPIFLTSDQIQAEPWNSKSVGITEKFDRTCSILNHNIAEPSRASHASSQPGLFRPSDLDNSWDQSAMSWEKLNSLGQRPTSYQPSTFLSGINLNKNPQSSAQNVNCTSGANAAFVSEPLVRNEFYPVKEMNLNMIPSNGVSNDYINPEGLLSPDKGCKPKDPLAVLPWLRGKGASNGTGNSRNELNSLESVLCEASSSCVVNSKAKTIESSGKMLGVSIFGNPTIANEENHTADISHRSVNEETECRKRKGFFDMNILCEGSDSEQEDKVSEKKETTKSFDLNSCITEEETPCGTSPLYNVSTVKVGSGIDLEALINLENVDLVNPVEDSSINEPGIPPDSRSDDKDTELAKSAASAIVALSSCVNPVQVSIEEVEGDGSLHWFVNIACSCGNSVGNIEMVQDDGLPKGLDDFEYMILRQKESTPEEYFPKPSIPYFPIIENGNCVLTKTRTRGRRGRQRRDFQRDILPGLTTLSRHEVTEDLQTFGGSTRRNATRNGRGRGRRRVVLETTPVVVNAICALLPLKQEAHNKNMEVGVQDRSLRGWGKTTRRPRRQRGPQGNPALLGH